MKKTVLFAALAGVFSMAMATQASADMKSMEHTMKDDKAMMEQKMDNTMQDGKMMEKRKDKMMKDGKSMEQKMDKEMQDHKM